jgi:plastocyanin
MMLVLLIQLSGLWTADPPSMVRAEAITPPRALTSHTLRSPAYKVVQVKDGGALAGVILYKGPVPAPVKIEVSQDQDACGAQKAPRPLIRVDARGRVADAVVSIEGVSAGKPFSKSETPLRLDQKTCEFQPHVLAVHVGETIDVVNSDDAAHNINGSQGAYTLFNILQPRQHMKSARTFDQPGLIDIKCNIHNWMRAYLHVFNHPYYQTTHADGAFKIDNIPAGKYQLAIWQEYLGEQTFEFTIQTGKTTHFDVNLRPKQGL